MKKLMPLFILSLLFGCSETGDNGVITVRAAHFPDVVHSAAMVGRARMVFDDALAPEARIEWKVFNAGPSVIEALFAGEIDIAYIGPNPAINGYIRSSGTALKIVSGASSGGAGLVIRGDSGISDIQDFREKRVATPQLGNTQDVACRSWLAKQGFSLSEKGGDVKVIPVRNPDQLTLFIKKEIDAAWTKEPWVTRLIEEGGGELFLDERTIWPSGKFVTAHVIARQDFIREQPRLLERLIRAHVEVICWMKENPARARSLVIRQIKEITGRELPERVINGAFQRTEITHDPVKSSLFTSASWAYDLGFLGDTRPELEGIYELSFLNRVLREKGMKEIE